jgi:hypothetical protein
MKTNTPKTKTETAATVTELRNVVAAQIKELQAAADQLFEQRKQAETFRREAQETVDTLNFRLLSLERQNVALRDSLTVTEGALLQLRAKQT